jgi:sodium-coupled neutral amino acid transporter 10
LLKSAIIARRRNYELLAFHTFGSTGKLIVELSVLGFLLGTLIAFFVVIGDIGPQIVSPMFGLSNGPHLRAFMLTFLGMFVALPLGLLRRVDSLTSFSMLSLGLYAFLVLKLFSEAFNNMSFKTRNSVWSQINYWDSSNLLSSLPIFSMALSCQTQLFEIFDSSLLLNNDMQSLSKMNQTVNRALYICSFVYISVGLFGYIAFFERPFGGNILIYLPSGFISTLTLIAFVFTVVISFPLCLFPCRTSLHSFLFRKGTGSLLNEKINTSSPSMHMSDRHFRLLTIALIVVTIGISVLLPHIELVLGILGSTIGAVICFIFPALIFLYLTNKNTTERLMAQLVVFTGVFILIICTFSTLHNIYFVKNNDIIERMQTSKPLIIERNFDQNLDPEAIIKEEKELKLMPLPQTQQLLNEYKVKQFPTIDANKAKRQEELLQRLEKQQLEHKKLLEQQKELLSEMKKHNELHYDLESKNLVKNLSDTAPNYSIRKNLTEKHSIEVQNYQSIDKVLEKRDKKPTNRETLIKLSNEDKSVLKETKLSPNMSDKNVIKTNSVKVSQQKDLQIKQLVKNKTNSLGVESNSLEKENLIQKQERNEKLSPLNNTPLNDNKESETLLRRSALSSLN